MYVGVFVYIYTSRYMPYNHLRSGSTSALYIRIRIYVAVPLTLPFSSVAMRLGPVPAGPVHSCVGAPGRFAAVCCVRGGVLRGIKSSSYV